MDSEKGDMKGRIYFVPQGTRRRVKERIVAEIPLSQLWKWESMLFAELTCFTHSVDLFQPNGRKSDDDYLWFHRSESLEVDMADSLEPQLDVHLGFETFGIHGRFHLVWFENELSALSPSPSYALTILFNKASTELFVIVGTCKTFLMQLFLRRCRMERCRCAEWDVWCGPMSK